MALLSRWRRRLAVLFHRERFDRELEEEMQSHLEMQAEENRANGMDAAQASRAAKRQFGNGALLKEDSRDVWRWGPVERLAQDVLYAVRALRKNPGFATVAILSLAVGIGANMAIFTVINAALLRALPVRDPGRLVIAECSADAPLNGVWTKNSYNRTDEATGRRFYNTFPLAALREFRAKASDAAEAFAFFSPGGVGASDRSGVRAARLTLVSGDFFAGLGVPMALGRGLLESDDQPGASAAVVTYDFWQRSLDRDAAVLGRVLRLNGAPMTIVGVAGPGFRGIAASGFDGPADVFAPLSAVDAIAPLEFSGSSRPKTTPDYWWIQIMARLRPGVAANVAADRLTAVLRGAFQDSGAPGLLEAKNPRIVLTPGDKGLDTLRRQIKRPLLILLAVAGVVLLLACINLASLQTARSAARRREIAVRLSLGAGRKRILRQLLIESLLLAAMGAGAGAMLATWGARLIASLLTIGPAFDAVWLDLSPDLRILAFTLFAAAFTSVAFGLAPAWQATRVDIAPILKDEVRGVTRRSAWSAGKALIAGQAALSLALLTGAGLFLRTLANLYGLDAGFVRDRLLLFRLDPGQLGRKPEQVRPEYDAILRSIAATPGVRSAAAMSHWLIGGWRNSTRLSSDETGWQPVDVMMNTVSPGFFETVGMPIVAGRAFLPQDSSLSRPAVILNQSAARRLCGERPAVGQVLNRQTTGSPYPVEVIGVARDAKFESLRSPTEPTVFVLFPSSYPATGRSFAVRTAGDPLTMVESIRGAISAIDRDLVMMNVKTETGLIDESLHQERLFTNLLTLSGCFALLLAAIGLYGVTAYSMARRTAEIGLRMALGAGRGRVLWLIVGQALRPVAAGTLAGFAVSLAATRWIESLLFGVRRFDPLTMGAVFSALVAVALAAAFVPAWRATHIDPMEALRYE